MYHWSNAVSISDQSKSSYNFVLNWTTSHYFVHVPLFGFLFLTVTMLEYYRLLDEKNRMRKYR